MYLLLNVFITHDRAHNIENRFDIFKYTLASYSVISWEKIFLFVKLDDEFVDRREELDQYIRLLFDPSITDLRWERYTTQVEWRPIIESLSDDQLVWFSQNDDHIFIDYNLDILREGIDLLEKDESKYKSIIYSHWPEVLKLSGKLGTQQKVGNYIRFNATICDSIQIINGGFLKYLFLELDWQGRSFIKTDDLLTQQQIVGMRCGLYQITQSLQTVYIPLRELCQHFDGYNHITME